MRRRSRSGEKYDDCHSDEDDGSHDDDDDKDEK